MWLGIWRRLARRQELESNYISITDVKLRVCHLSNSPVKLHIIHVQYRSLIDCLMYLHRQEEMWEDLCTTDPIMLVRSGFSCSSSVIRWWYHNIIMWQKILLLPVKWTLLQWFTFKLKELILWLKNYLVIFWISFFYMFSFHFNFSLILCALPFFFVFAIFLNFFSFY